MTVPGYCSRKCSSQRDRFGVEVVGRLVEQQHVGLRQQQPAERDAAALAAGDLRDVGVPRRQAQRVGRDFELALEVPAVGRVDGGLQLAPALEQRFISSSASGSANASLTSSKRLSARR